MGTHTLREDYLRSMGIDVWVRRDLPAAESSPVTEDAAECRKGGDDGDAPISRMSWEMLRGRVANCTACELHRGRTQTVFGVGDEKARWMIIGEAPGADEDRQGEPFVGRAGQLLNRMLLALGLARSDVFIANILKCRPPNNRDPQLDEVAHCQPYLMRQIELINPGVVLAVGRIAAQQLLGSTVSLGKLRGRVHQLPALNTPVVVTYHPAYLLRSPHDKRKAWIDLCFAKQQLGTASSN